MSDAQIQPDQDQDQSGDVERVEFDPLHKWLGIPPREQPPNHYRLLSINLFEDDADVIDAAAQRQLSFVRQCAIGPHSEISQHVINLLSEAQLFLLTPDKKASYDAQLKAELKAKQGARQKTGGNATDDSQLQQQIQKLDEQKQQIELLLDKCEFAAAVNALERIASIKNPKLAKYADWAQKQIPKATRGTNEMRESAAAIMETAQKLFNRHDYTGTTQILEQIPTKYRTEECQQLLQECVDLQEEIVMLQEDIDRAESLKKYEDLLPTVERLLQLKPTDQRAKQLQIELKTYGKGAGMRLGGRGDGKFDAVGSNFSLAKTALFVIIPLAMFGTVSWFTLDYLRSTNKTIQVEIDDPSAKIMIDGNEVKTSGTAAAVTLKVGIHDLVVERNNAIVHRRQFEVVKDKNPVLRIALMQVENLTTPDSSVGDTSASDELTNTTQPDLPEKPQVTVTEYLFRNDYDLEQWDVFGTPKVLPNGGLECRRAKVDRKSPILNASIVRSKRVHSYPLAVKFTFRFVKGGEREVFFGFSNLRVGWNLKVRNSSRMKPGGIALLKAENSGERKSEWDLPAIPIVADRQYDAVMQVDRNKEVTITIDSRTVLEHVTLETDDELAGKIYAGARDGRVVYEKIVVEEGVE